MSQGTIVIKRIELEEGWENGYPSIYLSFLFKEVVYA
jgi:hypothetical protein